MTARLGHSLLVWTSLLLLLAGSFLRTGMVLCISDHGDHGHVSLETNCVSACESECAQTGKSSTDESATSAGAHSGCRDVPVEVDPTTPKRLSSTAPQFDQTSDIPVAILDAPIALSPAYSSNARLNGFDPRPPAALSRLRVIVLQV